jgi:hypothetical protein
MSSLQLPSLESRRQESPLPFHQPLSTSPLHSPFDSSPLGFSSTISSGSAHSPAIFSDSDWVDTDFSASPSPAPSGMSSCDTMTRTNTEMTAVPSRSGLPSPVIHQNYDQYASVAQGSPTSATGFAHTDFSAHPLANSAYDSGRYNAMFESQYVASSSSAPTDATRWIDPNQQYQLSTPNMDVPLEPFSFGSAPSNSHLSSAGSPTSLSDAHLTGSGSGGNSAEGFNRLGLDLGAEEYFFQVESADHAAHQSQQSGVLFGQSTSDAGNQYYSPEFFGHYANSPFSS